MPNATASGTPVGVTFHPETLHRLGHHGDNWCHTWAADDSLIASMDDGNWLAGPHEYNNHLYRLVGGPEAFERHDLPGYPQFIANEGGWFGYGICSLAGTLYSFVSKCPLNRWSGPFRGVKLLKSTDNGASWARVAADGSERPLGPWDAARYDVSPEEMFWLEPSPREAHGGVAYPFGSCAVVQRGRDGQLDDDGYVYIYSPEGATCERLLLARAPRAALGVRAQWRFFAGWHEQEPLWSADLEARQPVYTFPAGSHLGAFGWYSWLPSVVYNAGLGLYLMANGGTYGGHGLSAAANDYYDRWMHTRSGSMGLWWAQRPWGPWHPFFYVDEWTVDSPDNRTYQPKLSPKWISADGRRMVLAWSDAMRNAAGRSHTVNYLWNQMAITIETEPAG